MITRQAKTTGAIIFIVVCTLLGIPGADGLPGQKEAGVNTPEKQYNRLIHEKSPYLLQHADNPVDWYPWGEEAFQKARAEDKPILVSIGYSTCHWCHVMAEESFSDRQVAAVMNEYFVNIKVDREERPDLDKVYITAVSALTGSAGWPLNVFLTPDTLQPFFGGTYFPRKPHPRMMSWPDLLVQIGRSWKDTEKRKTILSSAETLTALLKKNLAENHPATGSVATLNDSFLLDAFSIFRKSYEPRKGGFGSAPKFPQPSILEFLIAYSVTTPDRENASQARRMALHTLTEMARGGIFDQLGGGFHRYSVDADWHVPHFEKMLYDNAQLISVYLAAFQASSDTFYRKVAADTIDYVLDRMTHPEGGFYSAEDADSLPGNLTDPAGHEKEEGAYYVWTQAEVSRLLDEEQLPVAAYLYGIETGGNVKQDPAGEFRNKNILYRNHMVSEAAQAFSLLEQDIRAKDRQVREKLLAFRSRRPAPHLDDKIITAWNGLMISALARAYQVTERPAYLEAAVRAADFLRARLYDPKTRQLYRIWREGERRIPGTASDYAFLARGLVDLYEADFQQQWLEWADLLAGELIHHFYDDLTGGFYMTRPEHDPHLLLRIKEESDNVLPAPGSVAAMVLWKLSHYRGNKDYAVKARKTAQSALQNPNLHPSQVPQMLVSLQAILADSVQVVIAGEKTDSHTRDLLRIARRPVIPGRILFLVSDSAEQQRLGERFAFMRSVKPLDGKPAAYVCTNHTCRAPVTDPEKLADMLSPQ